MRQLRLDAAAFGLEWLRLSVVGVAAADFKNVCLNVAAGDCGLVWLMLINFKFKRQCLAGEDDPRLFLFIQRR